MLAGKVPMAFLLRAAGCLPGERAKASGAAPNRSSKAALIVSYRRRAVSVAAAVVVHTQAQSSNA